MVALTEQTETCTSAVPAGSIGSCEVLEVQEARTAALVLATKKEESDSLDQ
jgi:hypothetical protein